jgi:hypothetical protein
MDYQRFETEILNALAEDNAMVNLPDPRVVPARDSFESWRRELSSNPRIIRDLNRMYKFLGGEKLSERDLEVCKISYVSGYNRYRQSRAIDEDTGWSPASPPPL